MKPAPIHPAHCRCRACCPRHPAQRALIDQLARAFIRAGDLMTRILAERNR